MRKRYLIKKDIRVRLGFFKKENERYLLKALVHQVSLPKELRIQAFKKLVDMGNKNSYVRLKNRCTNTARSGSVLRHFSLSRISFRELASYGKLTGVKKASW